MVTIMAHKVRILHQRATKAGIAKATGGVVYDYNSTKTVGIPSRSYVAVVDDKMLEKVKDAHALLEYLGEVDAKGEAVPKKEVKAKAPAKPKAAETEDETAPEPEEEAEDVEEEPSDDEDGDEAKAPRRRRRAA